MGTTEKLIIGTIEECALPELGIETLTVRVDTGAKTSSLHVDEIHPFHKAGKPWVRFNIHPNIHNVTEVIACEAPIYDIRRIKSSNGGVDERIIIKTTFGIADQQWPIQLSLTDRREMTYLMLLGRQGMGDRVLVDPSKRFLINHPQD